MAEISPLRRRMIEDMTVRNLSPATQRSYLARGHRSSAGISVGRPIGSGWRMSAPSRSTWWRSGYPGRRSTRPSVRLRFFYGVTLGHDAIPERIRYARAAAASCRWC